MAWRSPIALHSYAHGTARPGGRAEMDAASADSAIGTACFKREVQGKPGSVLSVTLRCPSAGSWQPGLGTPRTGFAS